MASVTWQGFTGFVQGFVAGMQAAAKAVIDATVGSVTLALGQANGAVALFLQGQAAQVAALTRFATSYGPDADSWGADWSYSRLGATYAVAGLTFARFTAGQAALIAAGTGSGADLAGGAIVSTGPGGTRFMVTADPANPLWDEAQHGYVVPAESSSATVPAQCLGAGAAGNVLANTITSFFTPIAGIDTVTNAAAATGGRDAESDPAYKARFPLFLDGLASADAAAIISAIAGVQQGLAYLPVENYAYPGTSIDNGNIFVVVDDGSHAPPQALKDAVYAAVYPVRGFGIRLQGVYGPSPLTVSLAGAITSAQGYVHGSVVQAVDAAWSAWIDGYWAAWLATLIPGQPIMPGTLTLAEAAAVAMAVPGVSNIDLGSILINGSNADLALTLVQCPVVGTISAS